MQENKKQKDENCLKYNVKNVKTIHKDRKTVRNLKRRKID